MICKESYRESPTDSRSRSLAPIRGLMSGSTIRSPCRPDGSEHSQLTTPRVGPVVPALASRHRVSSPGPTFPIFVHVSPARTALTLVSGRRTRLTLHPPLVKPGVLSAPAARGTCSLIPGAGSTERQRWLNWTAHSTAQTGSLNAAAHRLMTALAAEQSPELIVERAIEHTHERSGTQRPSWN